MSIAEHHHLEFTSSQIALTSRSLKKHKFNREIAQRIVADLRDRGYDEDGQSIRAKDKPEQTFSLMIWLELP